MRCSLTLGETNLDHAKKEASPMLRNRQDESGAMPTFGRVICDTHRTRATLRIRDCYGFQRIQFVAFGPQRSRF